MACNEWRSILSLGQARAFTPSCSPGDMEPGSWVRDSVGRGLKTGCRTLPPCMGNVLGLSQNFYESLSNFGKIFKICKLEIHFSDLFQNFHDCGESYWMALLNRDAAVLLELWNRYEWTWRLNQYALCYEACKRWENVSVAAKFINDRLRFISVGHRSLMVGNLFFLDMYVYMCGLVYTPSVLRVLRVFQNQYKQISQNHPETSK